MLFLKCSSLCEAKSIKNELEAKNILIKGIPPLKDGASIKFPISQRIENYEIEEIHESNTISEFRKVNGVSEKHRESSLQFEHYGDTILIGREGDVEYYRELCQKYSSKYILLKKRISRECIRDPETKLLYSADSGLGNEPIAFCRQNGIYYSWYPLHSMFCRGNIGEKLRMAALACQGETLLDLYAGIGYWVFPLIKAGCSQVFACDMNPWSIKALKNNIEANRCDKSNVDGGVPSVVVLEGDNAVHVDTYKDRCDRVVLGLLPSSQSGWHLAIRALRLDGGTLHIHENLAKSDVLGFSEFLKVKLVEYWSEYKATECQISISTVTVVKSYAPRVYHYVFDVKISKQ